MARDVRIAILGDSRDFSRAVRDTQRDASKLNGAFDGVGRMAGKMAAGIAVGVGGLAVLGGVLAKGFIDAAVESQKITAQTSAVIKSMGDAANITAGQVAELSSTLSMQSGIDDELIQSGSNILLTFGKIRNGVGKSNKIFDRATEAALNMSVALGTDMQSASMLVGKALNDPVRGLTALRRSGIQFTKQQEDQIKAMVESGDLLGAQKILLAELDKQFGGSAKAQATAGDRLKVIWGNIQEQLGGALLPIFEKVANWLGVFLPKAIEVATVAWQIISQAFTNAGEEAGASGNKWVDVLTKIGEFAGDAYRGIKSFVEDSLEALSGWWDDNGDNIIGLAEDIGAALATAWDGFKTVWNDWLKPAFDSITDWFTSSPGRMQAVAAVIGGVLAGSFLLWAGAAIVAAASTLIAMAPLVALVALTVVAAGLTQHLIDKWDLLPKASKAFQWVMDNVLTPFLRLLEKITGEMDRIVGLAHAIAGGIGVNEADKDLLNEMFPNAGKGDKKSSSGVTSRSKPPMFDMGGIMPGPRGKHSLAWVAGGETILPTHKQGGGAGITINIGKTDDRTAADIAYVLRRHQIEQSVA